MISYSVRAESVISSEFEFEGLSTDTKPTPSYDGKTIANGSSFFEIDTHEAYFYDESTKSWK